MGFEGVKQAVRTRGRPADRKKTNRNRTWIHMEKETIIKGCRIYPTQKKEEGGKKRQTEGGEICFDQ